VILAALLASFLASLGLDAAHAWRDPSWWIVPAALSGWYLADFFSGAVHMVLDYRALPDRAEIARLYHHQGRRDDDAYLTLKANVFARIGLVDRITYDFKTHHPRPLALGRRAFLDQVSVTAPVLLPLSLAFSAIDWIWPLPGWAAAGALLFFSGGAVSQHLHGSLHRDRNPWPIRLGRRLGLLITPQAHEGHHRTLDRDFSVVSGWSNPLLNRIFRVAHRRGWLRDADMEPAPPA